MACITINTPYSLKLSNFAGWKNSLEFLWCRYNNILLCGTQLSILSPKAKKTLSNLYKNYDIDLSLRLYYWNQSYISSSWAQFGYFPTEILEFSSLWREGHKNIEGFLLENVMLIVLPKYRGCPRSLRSRRLWYIRTLDEFLL